MPVNPGELRRNSVRQGWREATKQAGVKVYPLHGRQRLPWHVSAELLPRNRAAAAGSEAGRVPRLLAPEPELPCKATQDKGSLSVLAATAGRGSPAPSRAGSAAGQRARRTASPGTG